MSWIDISNNLEITCALKTTAHQFYIRWGQNNSSHFRSTYDVTVCNSSSRWTYDVAKCTRTNIASVVIHKSHFSGGPFNPHGCFAPFSPTNCSGALKSYTIPFGGLGVTQIKAWIYECINCYMCNGITCLLSIVDTFKLQRLNQSMPE